MRFAVDYNCQMQLVHYNMDRYHSLSEASAVGDPLAISIISVFIDVLVRVSPQCRIDITSGLSFLFAHLTIKIYRVRSFCLN